MLSIERLQSLLEDEEGYRRRLSRTTTCYNALELEYRDGLHKNSQLRSEVYFKLLVHFQTHKTKMKS